MTLNFGNNLFPPRGEIITSYNYFDIADGIGYSIYYGARGSDGKYITTPNKIYAEEIHTASATTLNISTYTVMQDIDFDIIFNTPKNIKGDILVSVPFGIQANDTINYNYYCEVQIYHYDGSTETSLGTETTQIFQEDSATSGKENSNMGLLKINQATSKHFKKGETLRFSVRLYAKTIASVMSPQGGFGHDPQNRTDIQTVTLDNDNETQVIETDEPTRMEFHVPFVLDI